MYFCWWFMQSFHWLACWYAAFSLACLLIFRSVLINQLEHIWWRISCCICRGSSLTTGTDEADVRCQCVNMRTSVRLWNLLPLIDLTNQSINQSMSCRYTQEGGGHFLNSEKRNQTFLLSEVHIKLSSNSKKSEWAKLTQCPLQTPLGYVYLGFFENFQREL